MRAEAHLTAERMKINQNFKRLCILLCEIPLKRVHCSKTYILKGLLVLSYNLDLKIFPYSRVSSFSFDASMTRNTLLISYKFFLKKS